MQRILKNRKINKMLYQGRTNLQKAQTTLVGNSVRLPLSFLTAKEKGENTELPCHFHCFVERYITVVHEKSFPE